VPPSPALSARRTKIRYFTDTRMISDQKINDRTPRTLPGVTAMPCVPEKHSRSEYNRLVPMSP
jgi:hypothetical protein